MTATTSSFKSLAVAYKTTVRTLQKWLAPYPEIGIKRYQKLLSPKQVAMIFEKIGEP